MNSFFLLEQAGLTTGKAILKQCSGIEGEDGREIYQQFQDLNQKNQFCRKAETIILIADSLCWSVILSYTNVITLAWFWNKEAEKSSFSEHIAYNGVLLWQIFWSLEIHAGGLWVLNSLKE